MRFYTQGLIPAVEGYSSGERWNGWECPTFPKASADQIVTAWVREYGCFSGVNDEQTGLEQRPCAWFDAEARRYWFYHPDSDELESFDAHRLDGREVWPIGASGWTWQREEEPTEEVALIGNHTVWRIPLATRAEGHAVVFSREGKRMFAGDWIDCVEWASAHKDD